MQAVNAIKKSLFAGIIISTPFLPILTEKMDTSYLMYVVEFTDNLAKGYYRTSPESTIPIAYSDIKKAEKDIVKEINNQFYDGRKEIDENKNIAIDVIYDSIYDKAFIGIKIPQESTKLNVYEINTNNLKNKNIIENASTNGQLKELRNKYILTEKANILEKIFRSYNNSEDITKFISIFTIHNLTNPYNQSKIKINKSNSSYESDIIKGYKENENYPIGYYINKYVRLNLNSLLPLKIDPTIYSDSVRNTMILEPSLYKNIIKTIETANNNYCLNLYLLSKSELPLFSYYIPLKTTFKTNYIYPAVYKGILFPIFSSEKNIIKKETLNYMKNTIGTDFSDNSTSKTISVFYNTDYKKLWEKCNNYEIKKMAVPYSNNLDEYDTTYLKIITK